MRRVELSSRSCRAVRRRNREVQFKVFVGGVFRFGFGRYLNILDYALASLKRKKLKNASVVSVFSLIVFLLCSLLLVSRGMLENSQNLLTAAPDITVQKLSAGRQVSIPLAARQKIADIRGISRVSERVWGYYFDESQGANYTVVGLPDF